MQIWNPQASFTRPADTTAYAAGDLIANSTTAGSVLPMQFPISGNSMPGSTRINRARLTKTGTGVSNSTFRIHLYEVSPTPTNGDNGAWLTDSAAHWLGNIDTAAMLAFSDGAGGFGASAAGAELILRLSAGKIIYAVLAALGAYTPASAEVFTLTLEMRDA